MKNSHSVHLIQPLEYGVSLPVRDRTTPSNLIHIALHLPPILPIFGKSLYTFVKFDRTIYTQHSYL